MRTNTRAARPKVYTHEGARAKIITPEQQLRRSIMSCFLFENEFYEDGQAIADRIRETAAKVDRETVMQLAIEARTQHNLRHVPLFLLLGLIKQGGAGVADTIAATINRADEMAELLAMYLSANGQKSGSTDPKTIPAQLKKGLAQAFGKFDEYQLAKYNRDAAVRLRDVLFLCHPKPKDAEQAALFKRVANDELKAPDTWERRLSGGGDKKQSFDELLRAGKLGYMALLRNLRNMHESGVDRDLVNNAIRARKGAQRVLPFRYVAAARAAPQFEPAIDAALKDCIMKSEPLQGRTAVLVDVSWSMSAALSGKSDMRRIDAAAALASVIRCDDQRTFAFNFTLEELPTRHGMAGVDQITKRCGGGTYLGAAVSKMNELGADRLIVITDEQSHDHVPDPVAKNAYMINVASNQNGVGYGKWTHVDGFSEKVIDWIREVESF